MNETLKRAISGVVYITLLIASILYSNETFFILFGIFLLIAVYEYCALVHLKKIISIIFAFQLYGGVTLICFYKKEVQSFLFNLTDKQYLLDINITLLYQILLGITIIKRVKIEKALNCKAGSSKISFTKLKAKSALNEFPMPCNILIGYRNQTF